MKLPKYITTGLATLAMVAHMYAANPVQVKTIADYVKKKGTVGQYDEKNKGRFKEFYVQFPNASNKNPIKIWVVEIGGLEQQIAEASAGKVRLRLAEKKPYDGIPDEVILHGVYPNGSEKDLKISDPFVNDPTSILMEIYNIAEKTIFEQILQNKLD